MTNEEIAVALQGHGHEIKSLKHRMDSAEQAQRDLTALTQAVAVMTTEQEGIKNDVGEIKSDVKALTQKHGRRWEGLVDKIILVLVGAFIAWLATGAPGL